MIKVKTCSRMVREESKSEEWKDAEDGKTRTRGESAVRYVRKLRARLVEEGNGKYEHVRDGKKKKKKQ